MISALIGQVACCHDEEGQDGVIDVKVEDEIAAARSFQRGQSPQTHPDGIAVLPGKSSAASSVEQRRQGAEELRRPSGEGGMREYDDHSLDFVSETCWQEASFGSSDLSEGPDASHSLAAAGSAQSRELTPRLSKRMERSESETDAQDDGKGVWRWLACDCDRDDRRDDFVEVSVPSMGSGDHATASEVSQRGLYCARCGCCNRIDKT
eukprot:TRINITY_DN61195_c0_g1_i1.p1 TRINITY_DN61195_c0_g1~~TRINITY_DN61195_c0_g1_i1.p1  ORF type:complete len:208 (+),score=37.64 TRINITY_DN61195_c0_g1_i1:111-734(+)